MLPLSRPPLQPVCPCVGLRASAHRLEWLQANPWQKIFESSAAVPDRGLSEDEVARIAVLRQEWQAMSEAEQAAAVESFKCVPQCRVVGESIRDCVCVCVCVCVASGPVWVDLHQCSAGLLSPPCKRPSLRLHLHLHLQRMLTLTPARPRSRMTKAPLAPVHQPLKRLLSLTLMRPLMLALLRRRLLPPRHLSQTCSH